jgi:hypothetical protein
MESMNSNNSKFISKAEIVGSHFINRYCNALYNTTSKALLNNPSLNKIDVYKNIVYEYIKCIEKNINFESEMKLILVYFQSCTKYGNMDINECIDFILIDFVPESVFTSITEKRKKTLLCEIFVNILKNFTEHVIKHFTNFIFNNREEETYINKLQELFVKEFCLEKEKVYNKCINPDPKNKMVPFDIFIKIQEKMKSVIESKKKLIDDNKQLCTIIQNLKLQMNNINNELITVNNTNELYSQQILQLKNNVNKLNNIIQNTNDQKYNNDNTKKSIIVNNTKQMYIKNDNNKNEIIVQEKNNKNVENKIDDIKVVNNDKIIEEENNSLDSEINNSDDGDN